MYNMKTNLFKISLALSMLLPVLGMGQTITLGTASNFVLLTSVGGVTNSGTGHLTHLTGNVGSNSGSSTGFGNIDGGMHDGDVVSNTASSDLGIAYAQLNAATPTSSHAAALGTGETISPGVYSIATDATLNGTLTLDAAGDPAAVFIFQINGTFATGTNAKIKLINGALACNVYWKTEGMVSVGNNNTLRGTIVAHNAAIAFGTQDSLEGRALSTNGAITLNSLTAFTPLGCGSLVLTGPSAPTLGAVSSFALFSSIGPVSNSGAISYVTGDIGTNSGLVTGYDPLYVKGTIHAVPDGSTALAATALSVAYGQLNALTNDITLLYPALFGYNLVLTPHTYLLNAATSFTDTIFLNAQGNSNAVFVIKINGALSTISGAVVKLINGTQSKNVYWKVEGAVNLASNTTFHGTIVANNGAIDINAGAKFYGRALTTNGALTTSGDSINAAFLPEAIIKGDSSVCVGSSVLMSSDDTGGVWSISNPSATISASGIVTGISAGLDTISYTITNPFGTVVGTKIISVRPMPNSGTIAGLSEVCMGSTITLANTASGGVWTVSNPNATIVSGLVTGITAGLDTIRYTVINSCGTSVATKIITIKPNPIVTSVPNQIVCNGMPTAIVNFAGSVIGTSYSWTNDNTTIGLPAAGSGNIPSFSATNVTTNAAVANIIVTPVANGCTGSSKTFSYTVNPTPTLASVPNQAVCHNAATAMITFSGSVSGTSFSWTNDNTSISLAGSGTGNIASFTATNPTGTIAVANIMVTPSTATCSGTPGSFTITVNPTPTVSPVLNQTVCNGNITSAITFSGAVAGTTYNWVNDNTGVGLAGSGLGNIPAFTAINTGISRATANIIVTPSANSCGGSATNFSFFADPTPNVNTVSDQQICNGAATSPVNYTGSVSGTSFAWTNDNSGIGLPNAGIGDIPSFTGINATNIPSVANIIVTPSANTCAGTAKSFIIVVNPTPNVAGVSDQTVCNGTATGTINFTGMVTGTTFAWTNTNSSIGLSSSGSGNIPSFTAINTSNTPAIAIITTTPSAYGCAGTPAFFSIKVNPTPEVLPVANQSVCNGLNTVAIPFSSLVSGAGFSWTNSNSLIGLGASGSGTIPSFTAINNTGSPVIATITVIADADGCSGPARVFTIVINSTPLAPVIALTTPPSVCNMTYFRNFGAATLPPSGTSYTWSAINAQISDTGNTQQYALVNFKTAGVAKVVLTATTAATGCLNTASYDVAVGNDVADAPARVIYFNRSFVCLQNNEEKYEWGYDDAASLAPTYLKTEMNQDYVNATPNFDANRYWVMVSHGGCIQKTYYNKPEGALMKKAGTEVSIFPNPAEQKIEIAVTTTVSGKIKMEIFSMTGQKMYENNDAIQNASIDITTFPSGVYMVVCYSNNERISTSRFIKK